MDQEKLLSETIRKVFSKVLVFDKIQQHHLIHIAYPTKWERALPIVILVSIVNSYDPYPTSIGYDIRMWDFLKNLETDMAEYN